MSLLDVRDLSVVFQRRGERPFTAVDEVSFTVEPGQTVGLVGESGCGKSVTSPGDHGPAARSGATQVTGEVLFEGADLLKLRPDDMRDRRGRDIGMIFQDPLSSLNPVIPIGMQVAEVLERHRGMDRRQALREARELLDAVGIPDPDRRLKEYPHQISGGMRQRALIAIALACKPRLLIADEPTTALDVTIQAQILTLLKQLVDETGTALIMITHDLGVVAGLCDTVNVLYGGRVVERAARHQLFAEPRHPYTHGLLGSVPAARLAAGRAAARDPWFGGRQHPVGRGVRLRAALRPRGGRLPGRPAAAGADRVRRRPAVQQPRPVRRRCRAPSEEEPRPAGRRRRWSSRRATCAASRLAGATPRRATARSTPSTVRDLKVHFPIKRCSSTDRRLCLRGRRRPCRSRGETYGLVGESGCGKSTLGRGLLRLVEPTDG